MLILLILRLLLGSERVNEFFLVVKHVYLKRGVRWSSTALLLLLLLLPISPILGNAQSLGHVALLNGLPIPSGLHHMLFYLQRDPDANTVVYQLNMQKGQPDKEDPVSVFWVRYAENGEIKPLSTLQRKLAYGIKSTYLGHNKHELHFVSYPKLPLYLVKDEATQSYRVYTTVEQQELVLRRIFVRVRERNFNFPKVEYIQLEGYDLKTGKESVHKIAI